MSALPPCQTNPHALAASSHCNRPSLTRAVATACVILLICSGVLAQDNRPLNVNDPKIREMIRRERKDMDCAMLYKLVRQRFDPWLERALRSYEAIAHSKERNMAPTQPSLALKPETLTSLTELINALGQKHVEFCEYYKADPEMKVDDFFQMDGTLSLIEMDLAHIFRYLQHGGKGGELVLYTASPKKSGGSLDVGATVDELLRVADTVTLRGRRLEARPSSAASPAASPPQPNAAEQQARKDSEEPRFVAPMFDLKLQPVGLGKVRLKVVAEDKTDINYLFAFFTQGGARVSGYYSGDVTLEKTAVAEQLVEIVTKDVRESYLELHFQYRPNGVSETVLPGYTVIVRRYKIATDYSKLVELK